MKATVIVGLSLAICNDGLYDIVIGYNEGEAARIIAGIIKSILYIVSLVFVCVGM